MCRDAKFLLTVKILTNTELQRPLHHFWLLFFIAHSQYCKPAYLSRFSTRLVLLLRYEESVSIVEKLPAISFTSYYCTTWSLDMQQCIFVWTVHVECQCCWMLMIRCTEFFEAEDLNPYLELCSVYSSIYSGLQVSSMLDFSFSYAFCKVLLFFFVFSLYHIQQSLIIAWWTYF